MDGIDSTASKIGFDLGFVFSGGISPLRPFFWLFKHKNVFQSVPLLRRNVLLLVKSNIKKVNNLRLRRNAIYKSSFLFVRKIGDNFVLLILPTKFVHRYKICSPYFSETVSLIPYLYLYGNISDRQFYYLHSNFGVYRMIYQGNMPVRLTLTVLSKHLPEILTIFTQYFKPMPPWLFNFLFPKNVSILKIMRKFILTVAIIGELFGESYSSKEILYNNKAVTYKVAQHSVRTEFLENLRNQQTQNPIVLNPMMCYEIIPPCECILEATLEEREETKKLETTEILRIRSEIQAKNMADSIKRIALF